MSTCCFGYVTHPILLGLAFRDSYKLFDCGRPHIVCKCSPTKITSKRKSSQGADTTVKRRKQGSSVTPMGKTKPSASDSAPDTAKQGEMRGAAKKSNEYKPAEKQTEAAQIVRKHVAGTVVLCAKLNAQTADRGGGKPTAHTLSSKELPTNTTGKLYSTSSVVEAEGFATQLKNKNSQASGQSRVQSAASLQVAKKGQSGLVSNAAISALSTSTRRCASSSSSGGGGGSKPHDGRSSTFIPTAEDAV